jgi:hypothetical protein
MFTLISYSISDLNIFMSLELKFFNIKLYVVPHLLSRFLTLGRLEAELRKEGEEIRKRQEGFNSSGGSCWGTAGGMLESVMYCTSSWRTAGGMFESVRYVLTVES